MYEAVGICLPGSFIGSANEKAAGKARISAAQDSGTASKRNGDYEEMDLIHSPPQSFLRWRVGGVNWASPPLSLCPLRCPSRAFVIPSPQPTRQGDVIQIELLVPTRRHRLRATSNYRNNNKLKLAIGQMA